jgi:hypothetical protein
VKQEYVVPLWMERETRKRKQMEESELQHELNHDGTDSNGLPKSLITLI